MFLTLSLSNKTCKDNDNISTHLSQMKQCFSIKINENHKQKQKTPTIYISSLIFNQWKVILNINSQLVNRTPNFNNNKKSKTVTRLLTSREVTTMEIFKGFS